MTVAELIEALHAMPPYAPVMMESSDTETEVLHVEQGTCYYCPGVLIRLTWRKG